LTPLPAVPVPNAMSMATLLGDGRPFQLAEISSVDNVSYDGKTMWIALKVGCIMRGGELWRAPNLDAHVTLLYAKKGVFESVTSSLPALAAKVGRLRPDSLGGSGVFNAQFAETDYAWLDIHVQSRLHATLHSLAHCVTGGNTSLSRFFSKVAFHLSFRTWTDPLRRETDFLRRLDPQDHSIEV
jgi:uncharacterized membrane protein